MITRLGAYAKCLRWQKPGILSDALGDSGRHHFQLDVRLAINFNIRCRAEVRRNPHRSIEV